MEEKAQVGKYGKIFGTEILAYLNVLRSLEFIYAIFRVMYLCMHVCNNACVYLCMSMCERGFK